MADTQAADILVGTVLTYTGAAAFGALVGWFTYYINRYRKGDVQFSDVTTLVGVIGGGAITGQFGGTAGFGAYGIGLALGFFAYFALLWRLVSKSPNFDQDWFLDGRRIGPQPPYVIPSDIRQTVAPVALPADGITTATATATATVMALQQAGLFGTRFVQPVPPSRNEAEHIDPGEAHFAEALSIDDLDLAASARKGAAALLVAHPNVVFTSGRRDVSGQASAMAGNVAANRKWIEQTYKTSTERDALQAWVDANPSATSKAAIAQGLASIMSGWSDDQKAGFSAHFGGRAFDIQPVAGSAGEDIKQTIQNLPKLRTFLDKEGGLVIWHAEFEA